MKTNEIISNRTILLGFLLYTYYLNAQITVFKPESGQNGKDVIWVPTSQSLVDKMLDIAQVKPGDYVIDLGSGDGRLVISAAKRGATALGIEYNPDMVSLSIENAAKAGESKRATFIKEDLFKTDLSKATVITLFLLTSLNIKLRPALLELKPGTRIVSNTFEMGDWEPDEQATIIDGCDGQFCKALLWIVPAKVEGRWKADQGELIITQKYQKISGTFNSSRITEGSVKGNEISFKVLGYSYKGNISGNKIRGSVKAANGVKEWTAALQ